MVCFIPTQQGLRIIILQAMEKVVEVVDDVSEITHHFPRKKVLATQPYPYAKLMGRCAVYIPDCSLLLTEEILFFIFNIIFNWKEIFRSS